MLMGGSDRQIDILAVFIEFKFDQGESLGNIKHHSRHLAAS